MLYLASKEFKAAYDNGTTIIDEGLIQGGTKRIPIITLMSDGLPTIATDQYSDTNGTLYESTEKPSNGSFYRAIHTIELTGNGNNAIIKNAYEVIEASALALATKSTSNNKWYIPKGTSLYNFKSSSISKDSNKTSTVSYISSRNISSEGNGIYNVYEQLGNNGVVAIKGSKTLEISIKLSDVISGTDTDNFVLNVDFSVPSDVTLPNTVKVSYDGETYTEVNTNDIKIKLGNNEKVMIFGLPEGTSYTVTQEKHNDYTPVEPVKNGTLNNSVTLVIYLNRPIYTGGFKVTKTVKHQFGTNDDGLEDVTFKFNAIITDQNGVPLANTDVYTSSGELTTDSTGAITFFLNNYQTFTVTDLPNGTNIKVTETNIPSGFIADNVTKEHTVSDGKVGEIAFTNTYSPSSLTNANINVIGSKILSGRDWQDFDSYIFNLEYFNGTDWEIISDGTQNTATKNNSTFSLSDVMSKFVFDSEGDYLFRIKEEIGSLGGITYDNEPRVFTVSIKDNWNGIYEIMSVTQNDPRIIVTSTTHNGVTAYTVETNFTNKYSTSSTYLDLGGSKELNGDSIKNYINSSTFRFDLFTAKLEGNKLVKDNFVISTTMDNNCKFKFDHNNINLLNFQNTGTYYFIVSEAKVGNDPLMVFDDTYYEIKVDVTDDLKGSLNSNATVTRVDAQGNRTNGSVYDINFVNTRKPEAITVKIPGIKLYNVPLTDGEFAFNLYKAKLIDETYIPEGDVLISVKNDANGDFVFKDSSTTQALKFQEAGKYHFTIAEDLPDGVTADSPKKDGITYDTNVYGVTVTVTKHTNNDGRDVLSYELLINGKEDYNLVFTNHYNPFSTVNFAISGKKNLSGETPADGAFTFELYNAKLSDDKFEIIGNAIDTKTTVNGIFTFDQFTFGSYEELGDYYYAVKEVIPHNVDKNNTSDNIIYDDSVYFVKLKACDNGDKTIKLTQQIFLNDKTVNEIMFANQIIPQTPEFESNPVSKPNTSSPLTGDTQPLKMLYTLLTVLGLAVIVIKINKFITL